VEQCQKWVIINENISTAEAMAYKSDIPEEEWKLIKHYFAPYAIGRPRRHDIRQIVNAIRYQQRTGCQWSLLPKDLPPLKAVWYHYEKWRKSGLWEKMQAELLEKLRETRGRNAKPALGIIDSQSVKTVQKGGRAVMMQVKKSRDENATLSPTSRDI
jgi:transposase